MRRSASNTIPIDIRDLMPGMRLAVGLSGGADSVALLCALVERSGELGLVISAAHLHHGLRGAEADRDQEFARNLAEELGVAFHTEQVDVAAAAAANPVSGKSTESVEEAARRLRYGWFRQLMATGEVDAVATAHTQNDQAETVLFKLLRGAWTEGMSGIHPVVVHPEGRVVRPFLGVTRAEIEAYLQSIGQPWREDSTNQDRDFTRNRIRHELMPQLEGWNPRLQENLARMAELARDEESYWTAQLAWLAPQLVLPGSPVRGGGRAAGTGVALDALNLARQPIAMQRRILRYAAENLGAVLDFYSTEMLRDLALTGRAGQKRELANGLRGERTHRELRLHLTGGEPADAQEEISGTAPGEIVGYGFRLQIESKGENPAHQVAVLRNWKPGDRVRPRYSNGPRKIAEVLDRMKVTGTGRDVWPVLEIAQQIVWMKEVEVEPETVFVVTASPFVQNH